MTENSAQNCQYVRCYIAFLDIPGFKILARKARECPDTHNRLLRALEVIAALSPTEYLKREYDDIWPPTEIKSDKFWKTQIQFVTDCVIIFIPEETHALSDILRKARYLFDELLGLGFCLRGGITIGDMFWNDNWSSDSEAVVVPTAPETKDVKVIFDRDDLPSAPVALGPGLIEAYNLENEVAKYPRIVISSKILVHLISKRDPANRVPQIHPAVHAGFLCPVTGNGTRCVSDFFRVDYDGVAFLDVFHPDIDHREVTKIVERRTPGKGMSQELTHDKTTSEQFLNKIRPIIERLVTETTEPSIRRKYDWLANYFNESIGQFEIEPIENTWNSN